MSNLNKQAVYDLFFRIGKTAGITKIAKPAAKVKTKSKQPSQEELDQVKAWRARGKDVEADDMERELRDMYPEYYGVTSTPKNLAEPLETEEKSKADRTKILNHAKAKVIGNLVANRRDMFERPDEGVSFAKNYGGDIGEGLITQLARLDKEVDASDTDQYKVKYRDQNLAKQRLDEIIDQAMKYPGIKQIMEDPNKSDQEKQNAISHEMIKHFDDGSRLVHYDSLPPQQPSSPTVAPVTTATPEQSYSEEYETDDPIESTEPSEPGFLASLQSQAGDLGSYLKAQAGDLGSAVKTQAGNLSSAVKNQYNKYQEGRAQEKAQQKRTNITPQPSNATQAPVVAQPSEPNDLEISEEAMQSINNDLPVTQPQTSSPTTAPIAAKPSTPVIRMLPLEDVQPEVTTPAPVAQPSTPATPQTPRLTGEALQRRLADLEAETQREAAPQADAKINKELAKLNGKPQVDTFDRTKALNNLKGGLGKRSPSYVDTSKIESDPIPADRTYSSYLPAIDPSAKLNFGMGETPDDLVFTDKDLAAINSQYPEASPIYTPPVVQQEPMATNNAPVVAQPSTPANDLLFNESKTIPSSKQNLVREYYAMSNPPSPNAKPQQFYTIKNAPSQGYDPVQGITSRISSGNFGPAPAAAPAARSQNRAVSAPRVARKPRPVAKPTFDRKGYGDMMSDFGYNNTSPKPIPQNLTNLMPKRTTPINSVVGPAKPLDKILSNKPTATTSPAPKPVMDTTATTKATPQIKQSFLSQFGIY